MAVTVTTQTGYIIDGNEMNAGERAFARAALVYVIDGNEAGTAAIRQFVRDHTIRVVSGKLPLDYIGVDAVSHSFHAVTGRATPGRIAAHDLATFVIDGLIGPAGPIAARITSAYIIELE